MNRACSVASSLSAAARWVGSVSSAASWRNASKSADGSLQFTQRVQERTESRNFLNIPLRPLAVRPEIDRGHALFQRAKLGF